jgi:penicillin-binding protein A
VTSSIRRVGAFGALLLLALLINLTWQQVVHATNTQAQAGNQRQLLDQYDRQRGAILAGTVVLAQSVPTNDTLKYLRTYPNGPLYAPITGFYSLIYGATGIERTNNNFLAGSAESLTSDSIERLLHNEDPRGGNVELTINAAAQAAAYKGLAGKKGAVVAIDPTTGAILALATSPSFDPNLLTSHNAASIRVNYAKLLANPNQPMLDRAIARTYPPGSTFKLVTTAAALSSGKYTPSTVVPGPKQLPLPNSTKVLTNESGTACGPGGKTTLQNALRISCNTAYASVGMALGHDAIEAQAKLFGFGTNFLLPLRAAASVFPAEADQAQTALSAIGQYDVAATTLQMAMVSAGIANQGVVMYPYLVSREIAPNLDVVSTTTPNVFDRAISAAVAATETAMMIDVVEHGTGTNGQIPGVSVAGKTGTAQTSPGTPPLAWFTSFAPTASPRVAVAVVVENGGQGEISGNRLAAPIAKSVMEAVLNTKS